MKQKATTTTTRTGRKRQAVGAIGVLPRVANDLEVQWPRQSATPTPWCISSRRTGSNRSSKRNDEPDADDQLAPQSCQGCCCCCDHDFQFSCRSAAATTRQLGPNLGRQQHLLPKSNLARQQRQLFLVLHVLLLILSSS